MAEDISNGYFQTPCRKRIVTRLADLTEKDFELKVVATAASGNFDITCTLKPKKNFGDVKSITQSGNAVVYDDAVAESNAKTDAGVNTTGAPTSLVIVGAAMAQTSTNVGNIWKVKFINLVVVGRNGQTFTIPSLIKTFPSPL